MCSVSVCDRLLVELSRWENRHEYVALVEKYRLNEVKLQVDAIRRGLATIVPIQL